MLDKDRFRDGTQGDPGGSLARIRFAENAIVVVEF